MEINFERIEVFDGVAHRSCRVADVREQFADVLYRSGTGVAAHALALKIYNSHGSTEYSDGEVALIRRCSQLCSPAFMDAVNTATGIVDS